MVMPAGSVDVHAHVLDPCRPAAPDAAYDLFDATIDEYQTHLARLGIQFGVLVTASAHGTDNQPLLEALEHSAGTVRGVAVITEGMSDGQLARMHDRGVRAIRLQDKFQGGVPLSALHRLGERIRDLGWHIEIWTNIAEHLDWLPKAIAGCAVPVVLDHFGYLPAELDPGHAAVQTMIGLARDHGTWITMSGAYRLAPNSSPAAASDALRRRVDILADTVVGQLLWGSDWPYVAPPRERPDTSVQLRELDLWLPDPGLRQQVLVTNPGRCYGFDELSSDELSRVGDAWPPHPG
jgi:2-pyrone-4,6-dicarboxylate lactonase